MAALTSNHAEQALDGIAGAADTKAVKDAATEVGDR